MSTQAALQASAAALFRTHGYVVTLSRPAASDGATYDFSTGGMTGGDSTPDWTGVGFFSSFKVEDIDGATIKVGDRKLLLQAQGLEREPKINDMVDSEVKILDVKRVRSKSIVTHFVCQVRG